MRFKSGSKVEVMIKDDVLTSWCCAEIVSGNDRIYNVRYDCYLGMDSEAAVARVSRKFIRPCPPNDGVQKWLVGDIVEVFDDNCWRTAAVSKVVSGGEYYLVRLIGATQEFRVHKLTIRIRQSWQYDKWVVVGKDSTTYGDTDLCKLATSNDYQKASFKVAKLSSHRGYENVGLQESLMISSRTLKRSSHYCSSVADACSRNLQKIGADNEGHKRQRTKVDASTTYPREKNRGEEYVHTSFIIKSNGRKVDGVIGHSIERNLEPSNSDGDDMCSVGSCSVISGTQNKFSSHPIGFHFKDPDTLCSDAESFHSSFDVEEAEEEEEENLTGGIHSLELHAYRRTLGALYASGPLTWDKEALLTNLRISLHISNDEHLVELKNLISAGSGIPC